MFNDPRPTSIPAVDPPEPPPKPRPPMITYHEKTPAALRSVCAGDLLRGYVKVGHMLRFRDGTVGQVLVDGRVLK